jgi:hypothetical protein
MQVITCMSRAGIYLHVMAIRNDAGLANLEPIDEIDHVVEPATGAGADAASRWKTYASASAATLALEPTTSSTPGRSRRISACRTTAAG